MGINGDEFVLFAPLTRTEVAVSSGVIRDLQTCEASEDYPEGHVRDTLLNASILKEKASLAPRTTTISEPFMPTNVTFFSQLLRAVALGYESVSANGVLGRAAFNKSRPVSAVGLSIRWQGGKAPAPAGTAPRPASKQRERGQNVLPARDARGRAPPPGRRLPVAGGRRYRDGASVPG